jgi:hypothetical protein
MAVRIVSDDIVIVYESAYLEPLFKEGKIRLFNSKIQRSTKYA